VDDSEGVPTRPEDCVEGNQPEKWTMLKQNAFLERGKFKKM